MPALGGVDLDAAETWIRASVRPTGPLELVKERPWATVLRVPTAGAPSGAAFFKACRPVQGFEPALSAALFRHWPDRVAEVLAWDPERAWLLTADAGRPLGDLGNPPERWLEVLPRYAELQRGEQRHVEEHLANGVPDLRTATLPQRFEELLAAELPLPPSEVDELRSLAPVLAGLCADLAAAGIADSIQHDDLHLRSVFLADDLSADDRPASGRLRILDWGDASIGHPCFSLLVTFQFLRETNGLDVGDAWFDRLRGAYLEPWGPGLDSALAVAERVAPTAHALTWLRHHEAMGVGAFPDFDLLFPEVLRRAAAGLRTTLPA